MKKWKPTGNNHIDAATIPLEYVKYYIINNKVGRPSTKRALAALNETIKNFKAEEAKKGKING